MKLYINPNLKGFSNSYLVVDEKNFEAVIVDPGEISEEFISLLENNSLKLTAILITHNHANHTSGLKTLKKIYNPPVYAADLQLATDQNSVLTGDGKLRIGSFLVHYTSVPGHTSDSIVYKIENLLFTGDVLFAGDIGNTNSTYSQFILKSNIEKKIFSQLDSVVLMPGHGPPISLPAAREFNSNFEHGEDTPIWGSNLQ